MERVKSSDVLDVTHQVKEPFQAVVLGVFRRAGPNTWDDYEFVRRVSPRQVRATGAVENGAADDAEVTVVQSLIPVHLESRGCEVRLRTYGKVLRVRFQPTAEERLALSSSLGEPFDARVHARALRDHFVSNYLDVVTTEAVMGASAVIVNKLKG